MCPEKKGRLNNSGKLVMFPGRPESFQHMAKLSRQLENISDSLKTFRSIRKIGSRKTFQSVVNVFSLYGNNAYLLPLDFLERLEMLRKTDKFPDRYKSFQTNWKLADNSENFQIFFKVSLKSTNLKSKIFLNCMKSLQIFIRVVWKLQKPSG